MCCRIGRYSFLVLLTETMLGYVMYESDHMSSYCHKRSKLMKRSLFHAANNAGPRVGYMYITLQLRWENSSPLYDKALQQSL